MAAAAAAVKELASKGEMEVAMKDPTAMVIHFWASWCPASSQMDSVLSQLSVDMPRARFFRVEAEEVPEVSEYFGVSAVPFFVFLKDCKVVDKLEGANPAELANKISQIAGPSSQGKSAAPASLGMAAGPAVLEAVRDLARDNDGLQDSKQSFTLSDSLKSRIQDMVDKNPVILFMKGTPEQPQCGFSKKVVSALTELGVSFGSFDILSDDHIRQGLKIYSNWPTFPQLYCKGELLGGCDITLEMYKSGELKQVFEEQGVLEKEDKPKLEVVGKEDKEGELKSRLNSLVASKTVMLFMKGSPDEPRCGFSRKTVEALRAEGLDDFGSFDILSDDEVRQGMKAYSNWPTFPQLYIKGEFVGGCDIVTEMHKNGELKQLLSELSKGSLENRLKKLIDSSPVMLFMKGTPEAPRCGFSSKVVTILKGEGIEFGSFDITSDDEVRQGLKAYSNWPTYPQLYCKGELIGGCDIILEMQKNDELKTLKSDIL